MRFREWQRGRLVVAKTEQRSKQQISYKAPKLLFFRNGTRASSVVRFSTRIGLPARVLNLSLFRLHVFSRNTLIHR